jgi:hypothetical protein
VTRRGHGMTGHVWSVAVAVRRVRSLVGPVRPVLLLEGLQNMRG